MEDIENQSCQNNLRLRGLPETTGPENLADTVTVILQKVLDFSPPATLEFDGVHGALGSKPTDPNHTRDVICRVHWYTQKELMLRNAWTRGLIIFDGARVSILPDISRAILQRRSILKPLLEKLRNMELTCRWGFPFQLTIRMDKGGPDSGPSRCSGIVMDPLLSHEYLALRAWDGSYLLSDCIGCTLNKVPLALNAI